MTRSILFACVVLAACGGKTAVKPDDAKPVVADKRTEIERRHDAACEAAGPRLTACAIADSPPDELSREDHDKVARKLTEEFIAQCKADALSSRQVRVYEVCLREESECEPLVACLANLAPTAAEGGAQP